MKLVTFILAALTAFSVHASESDRRNLRICEEAAVLVTTAYVLHPMNAQDRVDFINKEKDRLAKDEPDFRPEDRHLLPAFASVTFHLVELKALDSTKLIAKETQMRLAARAGAACDFASRAPGAP